jgi:CubicO group peptidase (beta-lactamase class C family)
MRLSRVNLQIFLFAAIGTAEAQTWHALDGGERSAANVSPEIAKMMQAAKVPGLGVAVIENGQVVWLQAFGDADPAAHTALRPDTIMYGASLTKAAFAYLVMQLVDDGLIDLDAPVNKLLPQPLSDYPEFADLKADPRWQQFTPRMLLSHSTGMLNWRWINDDKKLTINYAPGSRYVYSGEGIQVMQLIVEQRTGRSVGDLMDERVFKRFGMKDTSMTWRSDFAGRTTAHFDEEGKPIEHQQRKRPRAAGSMDTTLADYAQFLAGVLRGEGLSPSSHKAMLSPQLAIVQPQQFPSHWPGETAMNRPIGLSIGLGWPVYTSPAGPAFFKEGSDSGTQNFAIGFQRPRSGVLMMANSSNGNKLFFPALELMQGRTCLPWFWMAYIPYDRPELRNLEQRNHPPKPDCN